MITARIIGTCKWAHPDDYCFNSVEGNTDFCPRHNRLIRKQEQEEKKALQKRADQIAKQKKKVLVIKADTTKAGYGIAKIKRATRKLRRVSIKRAEINKEYFKLVEQFKKDNPHCKAKVNEYCTKTTDDPHHRKGRGRYLLDVGSWLPVCRSCHKFITDNHKIALEHGWSESRLATIKPTI